MEQTEWVLPLRDGTKIKIPANKLARINEKIANKEAIITGDRTVLYADLAGGPQRYQPEIPAPELLAQAAVAFGAPMLTSSGAVQCVWIKQTVSAQQWNKYYSQFATYHKLGNSYDSVVVAYRMPQHLVDNLTEKCNLTEVQSLETKLGNG
jgi:hypothetical protein